MRYDFADHGEFLLSPGNIGCLIEVATLWMNPILMEGVLIFGAHQQDDYSAAC
jgi:hypothetical protein